MCHKLLFRTHSYSVWKCWLVISQKRVSSWELAEEAALCQLNTLLLRAANLQSLFSVVVLTPLVPQRRIILKTYMSFRALHRIIWSWTVLPLLSPASCSLTGIYKSTPQLPVCKFCSQSFPGKLAEIIQIQFCLYQNISTLIFYEHANISKLFFLVVCLHVYMYIYVQYVYCTLHRNAFYLWLIQGCCHKRILPHYLYPYF